MKRYNDTDPGALYTDCYEYVLWCTMTKCPHLTKEEAEDIVSNAFCELTLKGMQNIQNWVWAARCRGQWNYHTQYLRFKKVGLLQDFHDLDRTTEPFTVEVFRVGSLLKRKDAKRSFALWAKGYNRAEIAQFLGIGRRSATTMIYRLRKTAKQALRADIKYYHEK